VDEGVRAKTRLDAIVTVVDAKHLPARLEDSHEAADQIAFADVIVLNKTDLVSPEELAEVEGKIRAINRFATIHRTERAALPIEQVLGRGAFDLNRVLEMVPDFLDGEDAHEHDDEVTSVSFEAEKPIDPERFNAWMGLLLHRAVEGRGEAGEPVGVHRSQPQPPATAARVRIVPGGVRW
jgi:G3E family GTPase